MKFVNKSKIQNCKLLSPYSFCQTFPNFRKEEGIIPGSVSCLVLELSVEMLKLDHVYTSKAVLTDSLISIFFLTVY